MNRFRLAAIVLASGLAAGASADVIIGNYGAAVGTGTVFGPQSTAIFKAAGFTMPADYNLQSVTMSMNFPVGAAMVQVAIWRGAGTPQSQVAVLASPPQTGAGSFVFTPASPLVLTSGETYWVYVTPIPGGTVNATWDGTSPSTVPTGAATFVNYIFNGNVSTFRNRFMVEGTPASCYPDCDTSTGVGVLDIFDFLCFQNRYDAGTAYACDCDTSTGPGLCDIFDFLCFQNAYDAGCP